MNHNGPNLVVLRYRVPAEGGDQWVERLAIGTYSIEALELAITQPLNFDVRVGGGRMTGEGSYELVDADNDGDLDVRLQLQSNGQGCSRSAQCRPGEVTCEVTIPWTTNGFDPVYEGEDCLFLGRLEL